MTLFNQGQGLTVAEGSDIRIKLHEGNVGSSSMVSFEVDFSPTQTIQDVLEAIENSARLAGQDVSAILDSSKAAIVITDNNNNLSIEVEAIAGQAGEELGLIGIGYTGEFEGVSLSVVRVQLDGGAGTNILTGSSGSDVLISSSDNDTIDGGEGVDTLVVVRADASVQKISLTGDSSSAILAINDVAGTGMFSNVENFDVSGWRYCANH